MNATVDAIPKVDEGQKMIGQQRTKTTTDMRQLRKDAGKWLKDQRLMAGLSQMDLSNILGLKYYTFISQVENGFGRVPSESMEGWARALGADPSAFARELLLYYEPELHRLLFEVKK